MAETRNPLDDAGSGLIYCGLCGALNPATNHYCAACGTTLVDAFHATEGLRVFDASAIPTIISSNTNASVMALADRGVDLMMGTAADSQRAGRRQ